MKGLEHIKLVMILSTFFSYNNNNDNNNYQDRHCRTDLYKIFSVQTECWLHLCGLRGSEAKLQNTQNASVCRISMLIISLNGRLGHFTLGEKTIALYEPAATSKDQIGDLIYNAACALDIGKCVLMIEHYRKKRDIVDTL